MNGQNRNWWKGVADVAVSGLSQGALKLERVHLAIADETFNILQEVPVIRPWSESVRFIHHGISRVSYRSVALVAASLEAVTSLNDPTSSAQAASASLPARKKPG